MNLNEKVLLKLKMLNIDEVDDTVIEFTVADVISSILNYCNLKELPPDLEYVVINQSIGQILLYLLHTNKLKIENLNFDNTLSSITRGDVSMSFKGDSDSEKIDKLITFFVNYGDDLLKSFRRISW